MYAICFHARQSASAIAMQQAAHVDDSDLAPFQSKANYMGLLQSLIGTGRTRLRTAHVQHYAHVEK